ncbi:MAG: winged helix DNA-binding domain-containing protein [Thermoanaerobaculia bacterium]
MPSRDVQRSAIPLQRLRSQLLKEAAAAPAAVVAHFGAMQAQDYLGALWAVGLRARGARESDVERAVDERQIVRCWPMRGTLHFVAAADARWMLELLASRNLARNRARLEREFALDARTLRRCRGIVERTLAGRAATRQEIYSALEAAGVETSASRGLHIIYAMAHERVICFGPRRGKQPTFVLLDEWLPHVPPKTRGEALATLARHYVAAHAPASPSDLAWWSGLNLREAREAFALGEVSENGRAPAPRVTRSVHLLPPFDEYSVGYRDRSAILAPEHAKKVNAGGGFLSAIVVVDGLVAGTWKRRVTGSALQIELSLFRSLTAPERARLEKAADRYRRFLGASSVTIARISMQTRP